MKTIPWGTTLPDPTALARIGGALTADLALALAFRRWIYRWECCPSPSPDLLRLRLVRRHRGRERTVVIDAMQRTSLRRQWRAIGETMRSTRQAAVQRKEDYFLLTDRSMSPVLRGNLERLVACRPACPPRAVERALCDECPPHALISIGVLMARAGRLGIPAPAAHAAIIWMLAVDDLRCDLHQPLGRDAYVRRLWSYEPTAPQPLPEPPQQSGPPWRFPF